MLTEERPRAILEVVSHDGSALVKDLARRLRTSEVTIRKDLEALHSHGLLHRTHGGVLPVNGGALPDPTLREKEELHREEKLRIGTAAAGLVKEGQVVVLDSGTTTTCIARVFRDLTNVTIITNAVNIATELAGASPEALLAGGCYVRIHSPW